MFPIRNTRGRVIGFGGRVLGNEQPKYLNSPETEVFHKGNELYGLYQARMALRRIERLIVVEGYMDVVALAQAGLPNVVATLGTATGIAHFEKLFRHTPDVVCCFDGDQAGREAAWKALAVALPALTAGRQLSFMFLPDGEDPDTLVRKEGKARFVERIAGAISAAEYLFQGLGRGLDLSTLDGQARLVDLALPYIRSIPDGVLRELTMDRLAAVAKASPEALQRGARMAQASPAKRADRAQRSNHASERATADDSAEAPGVSGDARRAQARAPARTGAGCGRRPGGCAARSRCPVSGGNSRQRPGRASGVLGGSGWS